MLPEEAEAQLAPVLILIGFMGSGKTTVGREVASRLGWSFFDADPLVEEHMGMSVAEAFASQGEAVFRQAEEAVIIGLLDQASREDGTVVSLGGGAVTIPRVYERLGQEPLVVFLDEDVDAAFARCRDGSRPLAKDPESFRELFAQRESVYRSVATVIVETRGKLVGEVAGEVVGLVSERMDAA